VAITAGLAATATDRARVTAAAPGPLIRLREVTKVFYAEDATICMVTHDPPFDPSTGSGSSRAGSRDDKLRAS
jgi:hypothetical protein